MQTITNTVPLTLIPLPNGNVAALLYTVSVSDIVICLLLVTLVLLQVAQIWRTRRAA